MKICVGGLIKMKITIENTGNLHNEVESLFSKILSGLEIKEGK